MSDFVSRFPWLQGREQISLAELQLAAGCNYSKAKETLETLRQLGLVSSVTNGLYSAVNARYYIRRSLTNEEIYQLSAELSASELMMLGVIHDDQPKGGYLYCPEHDEEGDIAVCLEKLAKRELVHAFGDRVFLSIDEAAWRAMKAADAEKANAPSIVLLAMPLVEAIIGEQAQLDVLESLHLLPEFCKEFIRKSVEQHSETGIKPIPPVMDMKDAEECRLYLALDMLRALVTYKPNLDSKERYLRLARMGVRTMQMYDFWDEVVTDAADEMLNMLSEMSISDIRDLLEFEYDPDDDE